MKNKKETSPQGPSTIERFKSLLKSLLSVSKTEIDEAIEAERAAKECDVGPSAD